MASPELVDKHGMPRNPQDLSTWPSLGLGQPQHHYNWTLYGPNDEEAIIPHTPRYVTTDMIALRKAALKSVGIVQLPSLMVTNELKEGSLIHLLPNWQPKRDIIHLVYPSRRGLLPAVRALVDFIADYYQSFEEE